MSETVTAREPFKFFTRLHLSVLTGLKASTLGELLDIMKSAPGSSIYHHTHRFLQQHQYLSPEPPNDFAHWVGDVLGDDELAEKLASVDTIQFGTIRGLREKLIAVIEDHLGARPPTGRRFAPEGEAFHFIRSLSFVLATNYVAHDLKEFVDILRKITIDSIYFHIFEARLRLEKEANDFSKWMEDSIGDRELAGRISRLDPYTYTLEDLRNRIIGTIEKRLAG